MAKMEPMTYLEREPGAGLRPWVRSLWYARGMNFAHPRDRILPTGRAQVIVNLARDFLVDCQEGRPERTMAPALVVGQRSAFEIIETSDMANLMGIVFEPGALPVLLGDAADRVTNGYVALDDVCRGAGALRDRLREVQGAEARLRCLEAFLRERIAARVSGRRGAMHPAVEFALGELGRRPAVARVAEVARSTGWSERRFGQIFREEVGFAPKVWCRIQRFQRVVRQLHAGVAVEWPELALACGFYDQAHLANEFRAFAGVSPTSYTAAQGRVWANHLRVE
ncbi:MAG TPA: AraC family transcriptional regulator [Acidobacteriaceae bacterium]|jgi:AraC-like DNA-binding protein|nr:AraC family transcriptional regulator [Acidobacteriaceae bacterium]